MRHGCKHELAVEPLLEVQMTGYMRPSSHTTPFENVGRGYEDMPVNEDIDDNEIGSWQGSFHANSARNAKRLTKP